MVKTICPTCFDHLSLINEQMWVFLGLPDSWILTKVGQHKIRHWLSDVEIGHILLKHCYNKPENIHICPELREIWSKQSDQHVLLISLSFLDGFECFWACWNCDSVMYMVWSCLTTCHYPLLSNIGWSINMLDFLMLGEVSWQRTLHMHQI